MEIKSKDLIENLQGLLSKNIEDITEKDLDKINTIMLDYNKFAVLDDLLYLHNLKKCILKNFILNSEETKILEKLNKLEILELNNCKVNSAFKLDIKKLNLVFCSDIEIGKSFENSSIQEICLDNCNNISFLGLNTINKLDNIILNEIKLTKNIIVNLINSSAKYIDLNSCSISIFAGNKFKKLKSTKTVKQENRKLIS